MGAGRGGDGLLGGDGFLRWEVGEGRSRSGSGRFGGPDGGEGGRMSG